VVIEDPPARRGPGIRYSYGGRLPAASRPACCPPCWVTHPSAGGAAAIRRMFSRTAAVLDSRPARYRSRAQTRRQRSLVEGVLVDAVYPGETPHARPSPDAAASAEQPRPSLEAAPRWGTRAPCRDPSSGVGRGIRTGGGTGRTPRGLRDRLSATHSPCRSRMPTRSSKPAGPKRRRPRSRGRHQAEPGSGTICAEPRLDAVFGGTRVGVSKPHQGSPERREAQRVQTRRPRLAHHPAGRVKLERHVGHQPPGYPRVPGHGPPLGPRLSACRGGQPPCHRQTEPG
jgi:hypothetical protein